MNILDLFKKKKTKSGNLKENNITIRDPRIDSLLMEVDEIINKALLEDRYSFFEFTECRTALSKCSKLNDYEKIKFFFDIMSSNDKNCHLTRSTGEYINKLMQEEDSIIGIHRTYAGELEKYDNIPTTTILSSIMEEGLINNGHAMQGAANDTPPPPALTTSPLTSLGELLNLIGSYKDNNVVVILKYPKDIVEEDLHFTPNANIDELYTYKEGSCYIKSEYILGAIIKEEKDKFYSKEELLSIKDKIK